MWPKGKKKRIEMEGERYGRLLVIKYSGNKGSKASWLCLCNCGNRTVVVSSNLRNGHTQSCGCLMVERTLETNITHGNFLEGKQTRLYAIWAGIKRRCLNSNVKIFKYYGGHGIKLCKSWMAFENFRDWAIIHGYAENLSIDRVNNDGDYCPENCRWITRSENARKGAIESNRKHREARMIREVQEATGVPTYAAGGTTTDV